MKPPEGQYGRWQTPASAGQWYWGVRRGRKCRLVRAESAEAAAQRAFGRERPETVVRLSPRKSLAQIKLIRLARMTNAQWEIEEID